MLLGMARGPEAGVGAHEAELPKRSLILCLLPPPPRSHPTILDIPNQLYYDGELQACADVVDRERFCRWEGLPQQVRPSRAGLLPPEGTEPSLCSYGLEPLISQLGWRVGGREMSLRFFSHLMLSRASPSSSMV